MVQYEKLRDRGALWKNILNNGVLDHIDSFEKYLEIQSGNLVNAKWYTRKIAEPFLTTKSLCQVHGMLFENITPWAGQFRKAIPSFGKGRLGADQPYLLRELHLIELQMRTLIPCVATAETVANVAAFHHARLMATHAFPDGNGRTSRFAAGHLIGSSGFGTLSGDIAYDPYRAALDTAYTSGNLAPLSDILHQLAFSGKSHGWKFVASPFQINPMREEGSLDEVFEISRKLPPETICDGIS